MLSREIEHTPGKTVGISYGNQSPFRYFPAQVFQVFGCAGMMRESVGSTHWQRDHGQQSGKTGRVLRYVLTRVVRGDTFQNLVKACQRSVGVRCEYTVSLVISLTPR